MTDQPEDSNKLDKEEFNDPGHEDEDWYALCADCGTPNNWENDPFILAGNYGVCKACGGRTKPVPVSQIPQVRAKTRQPGRTNF